MSEESSITRNLGPFAAFVSGYAAEGAFDAGPCGKSYLQYAVIIVWNEPKRPVNLAKHGIDFADIDEAFLINAVIGQAKRGRMFAVGRLERIIVVIFMKLGTDGISIVSARPANQKERMLVR